MHYFDLKDGVLHAEGVSLEALAAEVGTPTYVHPPATLRTHYGRLRAAWDTHKVCLLYTSRCVEETGSSPAP